MPPEIEDPDENYVSEEDSDFAPEDAPIEEDSSASGDEGEDTTVAKTDSGDRKRPAGGDATAVEDAGFENSGDEAIIGKGKKRRKRHKDEDEGGQGGLIKTRSMRAVEKAERRINTATGPVTVDIDALWSQMTSEPIISSLQTSATATETSKPSTSSKPQAPTDATAPSSAISQSDLVRIKRTYNFAGKVHIEEKLVPRDSAEAKLYLNQNPSAETASPDEQEKPKRVLKKAFRSAFEPMPADATGTSALRRSDLNLGISSRLQAREQADGAGARKLNTVEKSRMDWAGFVDKEGIKDELELAGKSKHSFVSRQDFLARSEAAREDEARKLRMAGRA